MNTFLRLWRTITKIRPLSTKVSLPTPPLIGEKERTLKNECIVITNGEGGFGADLAIQFAKQEAKVIIWDKNTEVLTHTKKYIKSTAGHDLEIQSCDLSDRNDVYKAAEATRKVFEKVTMVVNTVSVSSERPFLSTPDDVLEKVFYKNIMSQLWITKAFLPQMIERNSGRFVVISSMAAHMGLPKLTDLCATNSAVSNFMTALRSELEHSGITGVKTTSVCPYFSKNNNLHKNAKLRLIHGVTREEVIERTLKAILNDESEVFVPWLLKPSSVFRWYCPNMISKFLKKVLIKDSNLTPLLDTEVLQNAEEVVEAVKSHPLLTPKIKVPKLAVPIEKLDKLKEI